MWTRLKNLWAWSAISPYEQGQHTGQTMVEVVRDMLDGIVPLNEPAQIVWPDKVKEVLRDNPEASLDDLITR